MPSTLRNDKLDHAVLVQCICVFVGVFLFGASVLWLIFAVFITGFSELANDTHVGVWTIFAIQLLLLLYLIGAFFVGCFDLYISELFARYSLPPDCKSPKANRQKVDRPIRSTS